jgi:transcriptional regulator with XRE-family HTH domain
MNLATFSLHRPIGQSLRRARLAARLSQADLARALGQPQSWVSKIELGERPLALAEALQILDVIEPGWSAALAPGTR